MKYLLTLLFLIAFLGANCQTLKITKLEVSDQRDYTEWAEKSLGKTITLTFYDNAIRLQRQGDKDSDYLKQDYSANSYSEEFNEGSYHVRVTVTCNYTLGILSSVIIESSKLNGNGVVEFKATMTANRF